MIIKGKMHCLLDLNSVLAKSNTIKTIIKSCLPRIDNPIDPSKTHPEFNPYKNISIHDYQYPKFPPKPILSQHRKNKTNKTQSLPN